MNNETINVNEESTNETDLPYPVTDVVSGDRISRRASKAFSDLVGVPIEIRQGLGRMDGTPFDCMYSFFKCGYPNYDILPSYIKTAAFYDIDPYDENEEEGNSRLREFFRQLHSEQQDYTHHGFNWGGQWMLDHPRHVSTKNGVVIAESVSPYVKDDDEIDDYLYFMTTFLNWGGQWMLDHPRHVSTKNGVVIAESVSPYVKDDDEIDDYLYFMTTFLACIDMGSQGTLVALPPAVSLHNLGKSATFMIVYGEIPEDNMLHDFIIPIPPSPIRRFLHEKGYRRPDEDDTESKFMGYINSTDGIYAHKLEPIVHDFDGSILELDD